MIHPAQQAHIQVAGVARHEEGRDLARAVRPVLLPTGDPLHDDDDPVRGIPFADQVGPGADHGALRTDAFEGVAVGLGEWAEGFELANQWVRDVNAWSG